MRVSHPVSDFSSCQFSPDNSPPQYWYEGRCPQTGELLKLPRTALVEAIAQGLMQHLARSDRYAREGKMYGVLLVELPDGEQQVLKAFSGLLCGCSTVEGWVPPIPGRNRVALEEARTLAQLESIKQELIALNQLPERTQYEYITRECEQQLQTLSDRQRYAKLERDRKRQLFQETLTAEALAVALEQLDEESRQQGIERKQLKRQQNQVLQPLKQQIDAADARITFLKKRRKTLSRSLQAQMHAAYSLTNFLGTSVSLQELMSGGSMPTGTGDCCAPKLLHYAAAQGLKPLAMAEFWWGTPSGDRTPGEFYGACVERCQPLMGFLLSGLSEKHFVTKINLTELPILYQDEWLIAVNKPSGLLSVPGRYSASQDSVLSRLRHLFPNDVELITVHRLDRDTSGILLLARDRQTYKQLSRQFQQRQVNKVYEAILSGCLTTEQGEIELPLWGDPENRPYQSVDWQKGKPSFTRFQVISQAENHTRIQFIPLTGRTHQLRVHAADSSGLGIPILGDRLYGCDETATRLHLHARELCFQHPRSGETIHLQAKTPF